MSSTRDREIGIVLLLSSGLLWTGQAATLDREYIETVRPIMERYCLGCHSTEKQKGEIDLERFSTAAEVLDSPEAWEAVLEQLALGEMPPKEKEQPTLTEKAYLTAWAERALREAAEARAGDPGPVMLRRLSNAEYTYSIRDLTGVDLDPAREFPIDGAAGEGFMNAGEALVMSPSLVTKYLDAAKDIATHAVLLPDGMRFSARTTRRDWTDEIVREIKALYRQYADEEGRLPLERYLRATLALRADPNGIESVATRHQLNPKYLSGLFGVLAAEDQSPVLAGLRHQWRLAEDVTALEADIGRWQKALWKQQNVGHIKSWQVPLNPLRPSEEVRARIPAEAQASAQEVTFYLVVGDAGDGDATDVVIWERPRVVVPGRPPLLLRDARQAAGDLTAQRRRVFEATARSLEAVAEIEREGDALDTAECARRYGIEGDLLGAWLEYLGIRSGSELKVEGYFTEKVQNATYNFVQGWGSNETPSLVANSSDQHVRIPGNMRPGGVAVHPSPTLQAAVGWLSPVNGALRLQARIVHAHPECGNGVTWSVELRRGGRRTRLADGTAGGNRTGQADQQLTVQRGDLVSLLIGPRDGNHACDLTDVELILEEPGGRVWSLAADVASDVQAGNPHADSFGQEGIWHFYTEPASGQTAAPAIPAGSLLTRWQNAANAEAKLECAQQLQELLLAGPPPGKDAPDAALYRQLAAMGGPLLSRVAPVSADDADSTQAAWGLDPALFGRHPTGGSIDPASLCVQAPAVLEVRLPADLVAGGELTGVCRLEAGTEGSVQVRLQTLPPLDLNVVVPDVPVLVNDNTWARERWEKAFDEFRAWFPAALCYSRVVPVDEVITLTLFHREDEALGRLMLDPIQQAQLDRLWDELRYISQDAFGIVDGYAQLMEYATQDSDPRLFEHLRQPILDRAEALRRRLIDTEPAHLNALFEFAERAYRRPLTTSQTGELRGLYHKLRAEELPHEEAFRLTLARILVSPAFLYRLEESPADRPSAPVSGSELATRLSYFLWSSVPDNELSLLGRGGQLLQEEVLAEQARRMLQDGRVRRLAIEFGCQWLHIHGFDTLDEKSERHFPTFTELRGFMYEEAIRLFTDLFQNDGSVLALLEARHTFLNEALARHYQIPGVAGPDWRRVDGVNQYGRGGILALGAILAKQSGASRTSPILRGNWVAEALLGDRLPRPPKDVPQLPDDETATEHLTVRELVEKHSSDPSCARCHVRIDPFGYALEEFDAIGRRRDVDLAGRPIDSRARLMDGTELAGLAGLRNYLLQSRRDAFLEQFCRKLLGYALGRAVQLSDGPLLTEMQRQLRENNYRFSKAVETVVRSRQFREIRGRVEQ